MRSTYIVSYDVSDPKRLAKTAKVCRNFGDRIQKSVFACLLTHADLVMLRTKLSRVIHRDADQVLFIRLGTAPEEATTITALGKPYVPVERVAVIA